MVYFAKSQWLWQEFCFSALSFRVGLKQVFFHNNVIISLLSTPKRDTKEVIQFKTEDRFVLLCFPLCFMELPVGSRAVSEKKSSLPLLRTMISVKGVRCVGHVTYVWQRLCWSFYFDICI